MAKYLFMLCIVCSLSACSPFKAGPKTGIAPETLFETLMAQPAPADVTELQGVAEIWQGYGMYLRFTVPTPSRDLLFEDFEDVPCEEIIQEFRLPSPDYNLFTPSWNPDSLNDPQCLVEHNIQNDQTHAGTNFVMFDSLSGIIYLVGTGA